MANKGILANPFLSPRRRKVVRYSLNRRTNRVVSSPTCLPDRCFTNVSDFTRHKADGRNEEASAP